MSYATARHRSANSEVNKLYPEDRAIHEWYRFVLSFPPHLVREYLARFGVDYRHCVLDPFCGTGTVLVECKKLGIPSIGIEANPMAHFAAQVKVDWNLSPDHLLEHASQVAETAAVQLKSEGIEDIAFFQVMRNDVPLRTLSSELDLQFGPEVGVGAPKHDAPVVATWLSAIRAMVNDLRTVQSRRDTHANVHLADARDVVQVLAPNSIDVVITSPPYPNEKDYTRTTRLESVLLGFISNKAELQALKRGLVRSNTRGVYKDDTDDQWVAEHLEIQRIAEAIEVRRIELGKTSGFERLYARVTKLYFGGIARHLADLRSALRPNAQLAYVVGDQASYLRVKIPTGQLLADIAQSLGYELVSIDLFRTRLATATKEQLREEVVVLRWPGTISPE